MSAGRTKPLANSRTARSQFSRILKLVEAGEEIVVTRSGKPLARFQPSTALPRTFLDTNILVYGDDGDEPEKQRKALDLIAVHRLQRTGVVSLQVLQEYFTAVTRKQNLDPAIARNKVEVYSRFHLGEPGVSDILAAIDIHRLHGFSYWDALVLRMAKQTGCSVLLSEDMQHGQEFDGVRIMNPFL